MTVRLPFTPLENPLRKKPDVWPKGYVQEKVEEELKTQAHQAKKLQVTVICNIACCSQAFVFCLRGVCFGKGLPTKVIMNCKFIILKA